MKLEHFLKNNGISDAEFGKKIRVSSRSVSFYKSGKRIPRPDVMDRIVKATKGAVTANSFYGGDV